ncbi:MAG: DNA repair protein RecN [Ruminococcaceae bacterium]|nr:DNA repair protein RecN [Oscillospiraceae bacterium]
MLNYLHIENIAVIEQSNIKFEEGFNVMTGETGAGKSIIIDAIYAVIGHRTSKELIRNGCGQARVSAVFSNVNDECVKAFSDNGIFTDEDGNFLIERMLSLNGNGYLRVNGTPISATLLRSISPMLINIHGQHDNQILLDETKHYIYIDRIAENNVEFLAYQEEFNHFNSIRAKLKSLEMDEDEKLRRIDILKYQIEELKNADLKLGEIEELKERLSIAKNIGNKINTLNKSLEFLKSSEESRGAVGMLVDVIRFLSLEKDGKYEAETDKLQDALDSASAAMQLIEEKINSLSSDDYNINVIEDRLAVLSFLASKYGKDEKEMLEFLYNAEKELEQILFNDEEIDRLSDQLTASQEMLIKKAEKLSKTRISAAKLFEQKVKEILVELNMPSAHILVKCNKGRYTRNGCDEITFLFSANAGETEKPFAKIASGGELSRVMLAIKNVLAEKDDVDTLIFDEIDSGISGVTADKVGMQLKNVSASHQVICITHLAQIAVAASNHLLIQKETIKGKTYTNVSKAQDDKRVYEIARIMGGSNITEELLQSARQMINHNH